MYLNQLSWRYPGTRKQTDACLKTSLTFCAWPPGTCQNKMDKVITDTDLYKADEDLAKEMWYYAGYTLLSVIFFILLVVCLACDPKAVVIAFGTGSPCCLLSPCIRSLYKYTDPSKIIQDGANTYVPGIIVEDDGTIKSYEPSQEEKDLLYELIDEFMKIP